MDIWLINPYGPIPNEGWRDYRFVLLGKELSRKGYNVVWWTSNFSHHFKYFRAKKSTDINVVNGFTIRLVPTLPYWKNIGLKRIVSEFVFSINMFLSALNKPAPTIIIAIDPPQIVGLLSTILSKKYAVPLILDIFDLWPELFANFLPSRIKKISKVLFFPLTRIRKFNYEHAIAIVSLCKTYLNVALDSISLRNLKYSAVIYNGIDVNLFRTIQSENNMCEQRDVKERLKGSNDVWAIFAGSLGPNYDIFTLLDAAGLLANKNSKIRIIIAGDGPLRSEVESMSNILYNHLYYLGKIDHFELIELYSVCDIGLCAYGPASNVAMPDKVYDYMAAGLPVLNSLEGELKELIQNQKLGLQYIPGNPLSLVEQLEKIAENEELKKSFALNASKIAEVFDSNNQYKLYSELIEKVIKQK